MVRTENQDSFCVWGLGNTIFAIVADGMGGHNGGRVASGMTVEVIKQFVSERYTELMPAGDIAEMLKAGICEANDKVYRRSVDERELLGMGTTATIAILKGTELVIANVGDSRAYAIGDSIAQITKDQTLVQDLIDKGEITPQEALVHPQKHIITQAIGSAPEVTAEIIIQECGSRYLLLCSDGLIVHLSDAQIADIVTGSEGIDRAASCLIDEANRAGGEDNTTVVIIDTQKFEANMGVRV